MTDLRDEDVRQLVRSLDDLETEYAAGDLDTVDYETLRNDYTVRLADAVRADVKSAVPADESASEPAIVGRWVAVAAMVVVFAVGAGWLLARSTGERGVGETLTGNIELSSRQRVLRCQQLGMNDGLFLEAIQCFDDVLISEPENVEALSYRAWFLFLASGSAAEASNGGEDQRDELLNAAVVYLDQAIDVDSTYPDARAFRAVVADRLGDSDEVCVQIGELQALEPPEFFLQLTDPVSDRNDCP